EIAQPDKWNLDSKASTPSAIKALHNFSAESILITEKGDARKKSWLNVKQVKSALDWLVKSEPKDGLLKKAYICGYTHDDAGAEKVAIDFVKDRVRDSAQYATADGRTLSQYRSLAIRLLVASLDKKKKHITSSFAQIDDPNK